MNTREIAEEYRLSHWAGIMRERKESGLSIREYCRQAGFHENAYYYWQKKLREAACEELAGREALRPAAPDGWALCATEARPTALTAPAQTTQSDQLTVEVSGIRIIAGSGYPPEKLAQLLRELMGSC
jgi:transposase-like protein